ncbi:MAG: pantetheine-phosphate adenylyltransferase [bacterium]|nr:pantetheine-phosphate adenylyltransferase [bacterium]
MSEYGALRNAVVPGTFDPITNGHIDVIERAAQIFENVYVCIAHNPEKTPLFPIQERVEMAKESLAHLDNVFVETFDGLVVKFALQRQAIALIRGIRAISDFEFEFQMALMNRRLAPNIITLFMMPHPRYTYLNSSLIRNVASYGGDVSPYVPASVYRRLIQRFNLPKNESIK